MFFRGKPKELGLYVFRERTQLSSKLTPGLVLRLFHFGYQGLLHFFQPLQGQGSIAYKILVLVRG